MLWDEASLPQNTLALREEAIDRVNHLLNQLEADRADLLRAQQLQNSADKQRGVEAMSKVIEAARNVRKRLQGG